MLPDREQITWEIPRVTSISPFLYHEILPAFQRVRAGVFSGFLISTHSRNTFPVAPSVGRTCQEFQSYSK